MTSNVFSFQKDGKITYSGLHLDLFIYRRKTAKVEKVKTNGIWLGYVLYELDPPFEAEISLSTDDILFLYTDGIPEAWHKDSVKGERGEKDMFSEDE